MSNGFIYVVEAHFIDKIEKKRKKILDPSACGFFGYSVEALWYILLSNTF
jgi:hypothetical protein